MKKRWKRQISKAFIEDVLLEEVCVSGFPGGASGKRKNPANAGDLS